MLVVFIGGNDSIRRFALLRKHCSLYESGRKAKWSSRDRKEKLLKMPPNSFVGIRFKEQMHPEDGGELSCHHMCEIMKKAHSIADMTHLANERDMEIALGILRTGEK